MGVATQQKTIFMDAPMLVSVIIPTVGRRTLRRAVESVLDQGLPEGRFEVIVVNDTQNSLEPERWQAHPGVRVISTYGKERSVARNAGAAVSRGRYLNFLDDDDYLLPGALDALCRAAEKSGAHLAYGIARLLNENGELLVHHHIGVQGNVFVHVMSGEWVPLSTAVILAETFFKVGGFDGRFNVVEDKDLFRKVALVHDFVRIEQTVAAIVRDRSETTSDYSIATWRSVESREHILRDPRSFHRLRLSADTPYWRGRMVRAYLTCVICNFHRRFWARALESLAKGTAAAVLAFADVLKPEFWRAALRPHTRKNVF